MVCPRCGKDNAAGNQFCGRCGLEFAQVQPSEPAKDAKPCYKHPKELTVLSCGRCDRPICTRCVVLGPAGPRCKDCARSNVPLTARGLASDLTTPVKAGLRMGPWAIYIYVMIGLALLGFVRGCFSDITGSRTRGPDVSSDEPNPER